MSHKQKVDGKIVRGKGEAAFFTQLDWVQRQCLEKLGFSPYPGTLNLKVPEESIPAFEALRKSNKVLSLTSPDPNFCNARVCPVCIGEISCALIIPDEEVRIHGKHIIEILSTLKIKDVFEVDDGDILTIEFEEIRDEES